MTRKAAPKAALSLLWLLVVGATALVLLWWVGRQNPRAVMILTPVLALAVMGFSIFLAHRHGRRLDEVQIASQRAASYHASIYGTMLTMALMSVPPLMNWLSELVNRLSHAPVEPSTRRAVTLAFFFGAAMVAVMQTLISSISVCVWWRRAAASGRR